MQSQTETKNAFGIIEERKMLVVAGNREMVDRTIGDYLYTISKNSEGEGLLEKIYERVGAYKWKYISVNHIPKEHDRHVGLLAKLNRYECSISELVDRYQVARKTVIEWCNKHEAPKSPEREKQKMQMRYNLMGGKFNYLRAVKHIYAEQRKERAKTIRANKSYTQFLLDLLKDSQGEARKGIEEYLKKKEFIFPLPSDIESNAKKEYHVGELERDEWEFYHISKSGSLYYRKGRKKVRISDHRIRKYMNGDGEFGDGDDCSPWDHQIII